MKGILIFIKNPILGKAKTRLAKDIGNQKAHEVYLELLNHTHCITQGLDVTKQLYYAWRIDNNDLWNANVFQKNIQHPSNDLGMKMHEAFKEAFSQHLERVIIIGSDCYELTESTLQKGFDLLESNDAIIGPATNGGYYLIGLNKSAIDTQGVLKSLFLGKTWSHDKVAAEAISTFMAHELRYKTLPTLSDIDTAADLTGNLLDIASCKI